jgi:hypothetical protein
MKRPHAYIAAPWGADEIDEYMKNDIGIAERLRITATTLDGILPVKGQGREENKRGSVGNIV